MLYEVITVEEERRRETAEDEVLDACFLAALAVAIGGGEHVEGERQGLEAEEQHDQVGGRRHHDAAGGGDEEHGVHLGTVLAAAMQLVDRDERDQECRGTDRNNFV